MKSRIVAALFVILFAMPFAFSGCGNDDSDDNNNNNNTNTNNNNNNTNTNNNNNNTNTTYFIEATYMDSTYRFESTNPSESYAPEGMNCRVQADASDFYSGAYIEFVTPTEFTDADVLAMEGKDIPCKTFDNYNEIVAEIYIFTPESMSSEWCFDVDQVGHSFHIADVKKITLPNATHDRYEVTGTFTCNVFDSPDVFPVTNGSFKLRLTRWPL